MRKELQHDIINLFHHSDHIMKRVISKKIEDTGIYRSQHRLLMMLGKYPDCSQTTLAEKMEISPAAVAVSLKKLEKSGYIMRQCDQEDSRINRVVVTEKGRKAIHKSIIHFQEIEDTMFIGFSDEELELCRDYFRRIIDNEENYYQSLKEQEKV